MSEEDFDWGPFAGNRWTAQNIGDRIVGTVTRIETRNGQRGDYPVLHLDTDDGDKEVPSTTFLSGLLAEHNVQRGDRVRITFTESRHTGQPQPMKVFKLEVKREDPPPAPVESQDDAAESAPF